MKAESKDFAGTGLGGGVDWVGAVEVGRGTDGRSGRLLCWKAKKSAPPRAASSVTRTKVKNGRDAASAAA